MSIVSLKDIQKSYGATSILKGVSFSINRGDRAGLIGFNGCGKTTLIKIISGVTAPDSGHKAAAKGLSIGYLAQEPKDAGVTVLDEMLSSRPQVLELKHRLDVSAKSVSKHAKAGGSGYEAALEEYGRLLDEYESTGGYAYDNLVTGTLIGLGFDRDEFGRDVGTLSGGQRTRLALAKLLLAGHDLLLLDEPTNHLDISSIGWLEGFLSQYKGSVLMVSHDRYFLDKVADRIIEIENGVAEEFPGNYSAYKIEKKKRTEDRLRQFELASGRLEKEKEYINRMRAGVNSKQAKGREKRLVRFEMPDRPVTASREMKLKWDEVARSADSVLKVEGISKRFGEADVLKDVSFVLRRGERVGIIGRNGGGKSTLVRIIMGGLEADAGNVSFGTKVKPAYYAQGMEGLDEESTVLDELWSVSPLAVEQKIRDLLGMFLFTGDDSLKRVGSLSGGEKGRLAIAKIVLHGANLLVLDEPTNHLDITSRETLEDALSGFDGTVLVVSHDRYFLDSIAEKILELDGGGLTEYWGNYSYYSEKKVQASAVTEQEPSEGRQTWEERKQQQAVEKKKERDEKKKAERLKGIEEEIDDVEMKLKEAEEKLADPAVYGNFVMVSELTACYNNLKAQRDELYDLLEKEAF